MRTRPATTQYENFLFLYIIWSCFLKSTLGVSSASTCHHHKNVSRKQALLCSQPAYDSMRVQIFLKHQASANWNILNHRSSCSVRVGIHYFWLTGRLYSNAKLIFVRSRTVHGKFRIVSARIIRCLQWPLRVDFNDCGQFELSCAFVCPRMLHEHL